MIVLKELSGHPELIPIERGVLWKRGEDETKLWFSPAMKEPGDFQLHSIAHIETTFGPRIGKWGTEHVARLNRRSCFGYFKSEDSTLCLSATFSIYEKEPAARWIAGVILRALGEQLALGFGIAQSYARPELLAGNRANLEYPRYWTNEHGPEVFEKTAAGFLSRGLISTASEGVITLEVPLDGGIPSRMIDKKAETALLHVSANVQHPLAGCGYAATIALPYDPDLALIPALCDKLNRLEEEPEDFVPRFGAWGTRSVDNELVYSFFWPTNQANDTLPGTIMNWMVLRTQWLRDQYWAPGLGIRCEEVLNA